MMCERCQGRRSICEAHPEEIVSTMPDAAPAKVVNLMDALKKSLDAVSASKKKPAKASAEKPAASIRKRA